MLRTDFAALAALISAVSCIPSDRLLPIVFAVVVLMVVARWQSPRS